ERLHAITQRVGFALWQLQELEGVSTRFAVMLTVTPGIGEEAGNELLAKASGKPFGATVRVLAEVGALDRLEPPVPRAPQGTQLARPQFAGHKPERRSP